MRKKRFGIMSVFVLLIVMTCTTAQAGSVSVTGTGKARFYVYDSDLNELAHAYTNQQVELASGDYPVKLNNTARIVTVTAEQNTVIKAGSITLEGTGNTTFYVYNSDLSKLAYARTNEQIELFPGTYTVKLNETVQTATVQEGENTLVKAGSIRVRGTGKNLFYVYNSDLSELAYAYTNKQIELFPGTYTVKLNETVQTATVQEGENTLVKAGSVSVVGTGRNLFYVYNSDFRKLAYAYTNKQIELFPGTYTLKLDKTVQTATVYEGQNTSINF